MEQLSLLNTKHFGPMMHLRLQSFDGPLDLLLHLIKVQELNIFNIPMSLITEQFLAFLRQVPELDFHQAGEYLAMAAQLIEIKVAMLIPALQNRMGEDVLGLNEMDENDPRKPLVAALLEREALLRAVAQLDAMSLLGRDVFPSGAHHRLQTEFEHVEAPIKGDAFSLVLAFEQVLLRFAREKNVPVVKVHAQKITIQKKMELIKFKFEMQEEFFFKELVSVCESRYELIVTFMAILELSKAGQVEIQQGEIFGPILIKKGKMFEEEAPDPDALPEQAVSP
jgi:segregation and condensation protein A